MDSRIVLNDTVAQKEEYDSVDIDGEVVMMDLNRGKYYGFNDVGSCIWQLIKKPMVVKDVINILISEYNIQMQVCTETVTKFLDQLEQEELIIKINE